MQGIEVFRNSTEYFDVKVDTRVAVSRRSEMMI